MKKITVAQIMEWNPCGDYPEERVKKLIGRGKTPAQILDLDIPAEDRLWVVLREDIIPRLELGLLACDFAAQVLPIWLKNYPNDNRVANCIKVARQYWRGEASDAASYAARAAARAASDAASDAQIEMVRKVLIAKDSAEGSA